MAVGSLSGLYRLSPAEARAGLQAKCQRLSRLRRMRRTQVRLRVDVHDGRQQVCERLARAGLGEADQVAPLQRHGPALRLDGRRLAEARAYDLRQDVLCAAGAALHHQQQPSQERHGPAMGHPCE
jgi:hypothetical protein